MVFNLKLGLSIRIDSLPGVMFQFCLFVPHAFARSSCPSEGSGSERGSVPDNRDL